MKRCGTGFIWMINILKYLLLLVLTLLVIFAISLVYISSKPGEKLLVKVATDKFNEVFDHQIRVASLETNLFSRLRISGVSISALNIDSTEIVALNDIEICYRLLDLLKHKISVNSVNIDGLIISLHTDTVGNVIVPQLKTPSVEKTDTKSSFETIIRNAVIHNSRISFDDKKSNLNGVANKISLTASQKDSTITFSTDIETILANNLDTQYQISGFHTAGSWLGEYLKIDTLGLNLAGIEISGSGGVNITDENLQAQVELKVSGNVDTLASILCKYVPARLQPISGAVNISLSFTGSKMEPNLIVTTDIPQLSLNNIDVKDCNISVTATRDSIIFDGFSMQLIEGNIDGEGFICLDSILTHKIGIHYRDFQIENLYEVLILDQCQYQGVVDGSLLSTGGLRDPQTIENTFDFSARNISLSGQYIPSLSVKTTIKAGKARVDVLHDKSRITTNVDFSNEYLNGEFKVDIPEIETIAKLANIDNLTGKFIINGKIDGTPNSPVVTALFNGRNITYANFPLDSIAGGFSYEDGIFSLGDITFDGNLANLSELDLPVDSLQLSGSVVYHGVLDGRLDNLAGELFLSIDKPSYNEYSCNSVNAWLKVKDDLVFIDSLLLNTDSCKIAVDGNFGIKTLAGELNLGLYCESGLDPLDGVIEEKCISNGKLSIVFDVSKGNDLIFETEGSDIDLAVIPNLFGKVPGISGKMNVHSIFRGSIKHPLGNLAFSVTNACFDKACIDSISGIFNIDENVVNAESFIVYYKENSLSVTADCRLSRDQENNLLFTDTSLLNCSVNADSIDISLADEFLTALQLKGLLNGHAEFHGNLSEPHVNGNLEILGGSVLIEGNDLPIEKIHLQISMFDTSFVIDELSGNISSEYFSISGKASTSNFKEFTSEFTLSNQNRKLFFAHGTFSPDHLNYQVNANDLDLFLIHGFAPGLETLQGKVNAEIVIQGSTQQPEFMGEMRIKDIYYKPDFLDYHLTAGIVNLVFNRSLINLDSAYIEYNDGHIFANGSCNLGRDGFTAFNFDIKARKLEFQKPLEYEINLESSDLNYELADNKYHLDGDLVFGESKVLHRFQPDALLRLLQKTEKPSAEISDVLKRTVFEIRIRESENLWIDNNLAKIRLYSELALTGTPARPNLNGRLSVQEGYVYYLDRQFSIVTGILDFADPVKLNPEVTLIAETRVKNYRYSGKDAYNVTLSVNGPLEEPKIELYSDPPLDRQDILSLLTLGFVRDKSVMDGKNVSISDAVQERLEEISTRRISGYLSKKAESTLGLSQFSVEGNLFSMNNKAGPQLLASKRLTNRMEITYLTTVGQMNDQGIRLDYTLNKYFSIEGQTDQSGTSGLDIKYRIKY